MIWPEPWITTITATCVSRLKFFFKLAKKPHHINTIQKKSLHGPVYNRIFFSN